MDSKALRRGGATAVARVPPTRPPPGRTARSVQITDDAVELVYESKLCSGNGRLAYRTAVVEIGWVRRVPVRARAHAAARARGCACAAAAASPHSPRASPAAQDGHDRARLEPRRARVAPLGAPRGARAPPRNVWPRRAARRGPCGRRQGAMTRPCVSCERAVWSHACTADTGRASVAAQAMAPSPLARRSHAEQ